MAAVIERTLETTPADATHWSLRSMARESGLSHTTVRRIWAAFSVQPHRSETFKLSGDPLFVDKVRDIIGLYLSPPDRALVRWPRLFGQSGSCSKVYPGFYSGRQKWRRYRCASNPARRAETCR